MLTATRAQLAIERPTNTRVLASRAADVFVLLLGLTTSFTVHVVGEIPLSELVLLGSFPFLLVRLTRGFRRDLRITYILMAVWLAGEVLADVKNGTAIDDRLRGTALIVFFAIDLLGLSILLSGNKRRKLLFIIGLAVGSLAAARLQPSPAMQDDPWKWGYSGGTMEFTLLLSCFFYARRHFVLGALCILGICAVNLLFNYRSPVLDLLVTLVLVYPVIPEHLGRLQILPRKGILRVMFMVTIAAAAAALAGELVHLAASAGYLSEEAQRKDQSQATTGNPIVGGRPEFFIGLRAALDSPFLGHGSWPRDMKYVEMQNDMMAEYGIRMDLGDVEAAGGLIPSHSHIVGAWVWAGILGLPFWIYMLRAVLKGILAVISLKPALTPIYTWFLIALLWDIWFSPFASGRRISEAFLIVVIFDLLSIKPDHPAARHPWSRQLRTWSRSPRRRSLATIPFKMDQHRHFHLHKPLSGLNEDPRRSSRTIWNPGFTQ